MRIDSLQVEGFGVWSGLRIEGFGEGLHLIYGPNEAGKTTLLEFLRWVLYGSTDDDRRYWPAPRAARAGGRVELAEAAGRFTLERRREETSEGFREPLSIHSGDDGRTAPSLQELLSGIDRPTFQNVFAVGLREMQQLGTLEATEAASLLYNLSLGLDRVSLVEVMRELAASRDQLLDRRGGACRIAELLERRDALRAAVREASSLGRRYGRLAAQRRRLDREAELLRAQSDEAQRQARRAELAAAMRSRWERRAELDRQIAALGGGADVPEGTVERLESLLGEIRRRRRAALEHRAACRSLRAEASGIALRRSVVNQAPRIEALVEQQGWMESLERSLAELRAEVARLEAESATRRGLADLPGDLASEAVGQRASRRLRGLRAPAMALREAARRRREARAELDAARQSAAALGREIHEALRARGHSDLSAALELAGQRVAQLRRRLQLDQRLDEMLRRREELEEQARRLTDRQLVPAGVLAGLGAVFVVGAMLAMVGLFMPASVTGQVGWTMALLGLAGTGTAVAGKWWYERSGARRMASCETQVRLLGSQIEQARRERETLDARLPKGGGPIAVRLETAEQELASLEELAPLEARLAAARQQAEAAVRRLRQLGAALRQAREQWRQELASAGLPDSLAPRQVAQLLHYRDDWAQLDRRLAFRREQMELRRREWEGLVARIARTADDAGLQFGSIPPREQVRRLAEALAAEQSADARRADLLRRARQSRRAFRAERTELARLVARRHEMLVQCGAASVNELRRRAADAARTAALRAERAGLDRELAAAIEGTCSEAELAALIESEGERLVECRDRLLDEAVARETQLQQLHERRGQLAEQLRALATDTSPARAMLELSAVESRLDQSLRRWQVLALVGRALDEIRVTYERDRQPETLREASGAFGKLTAGRYARVWTPLHADELRIDDAEGRTLPVGALSRGTREQLFLSLRLALVSCYGRRGARLPLVLDDVLVNFDAARAKSAATVLRDFAAEGRQVLLFTCHEHIVKLFKTIGAPMVELPDNAQSDPPPLRFGAATTTRKPRAPRAPRAKAAAAGGGTTVAAAKNPEEPPPVPEPKQPEKQASEPEAASDGRTVLLWSGDGAPSAPAVEPPPPPVAPRPVVSLPEPPPPSPSPVRRLRIEAMHPGPRAPRGVFDADYFDSPEG